jgi:hypothetical protein
MPAKFSSAKSRLATKVEPADKTAHPGQALAAGIPDRCTRRAEKDHSIRKYLHRYPLIPFKPHFFIKTGSVRLRLH